MKNFFRIVGIILAVCLIAVIPQIGYAAPQTVRVILDGEELNLSGVEAYYDDVSQRIYVPVQNLAEALNVKCDVNTKTKTANLSADGIQISMTVDSNVATVNDEKVTLKAVPVQKDNTVYVPLYLISEYFKLVTDWNSEALTVTLRSATVLQLGLSSTKVSAIFGEASRTAVSEKGYRWWVYNDLTDYRMVGIENDKVVAYYLHSADWMDACGLQCGMTSDECTSALKSYSAKKNDSYTVYSGKSDTVTVFFDESGNAYAMLHENAEYAGQIRISASVLEDFAMQFADLVNVERTKRGLSALTWDSSIAEVASSHTSDMAKNNTYAHEGSDGSTPSKRLESAGFEDFYEIEIISRAFPNALTAFSAHLNNEQCLEALKAGYASMGAAAAYNPQSDGILYYTQVFYAAK